MYRLTNEFLMKRSLLVSGNRVYTLLANQDILMGVLGRVYDLVATKFVMKFKIGLTQYWQSKICYRVCG